MPLHPKPVKALKKISRVNSSSREQPKSSDPRGQLALYRDVLDAILKTGAVALPIPAILIYGCLRLIGHTELFSASVLSLAGLSAFLQAFLLVWLAFVTCIVAPSGMIYLFLGGTSSKRPAQGLPAFVLLSSVVWAVFYAIAFELWDNGLTGQQYWFIVAMLLTAGVALLGWLAWKSPRKLAVIPQDDRNRYLHWPDSLVTLVNKNARIAKFSSFIRRRRLWQCIGITAVIVISGFYSMQAILTVYSFAHAYQLPEHGWRVSATLCIIILVSLWPAAIYLKARVSGQSHGNALKISLTFIGALVVVALINGFSLVPLAIGTMRAMGIIDNTPRTYEIMKADERPIYRALGYRPKAGDHFIEAFIRFQFADVKLVCPNKYDFPNDQSSVVIKESSSSSGNAIAPAATDRKDNEQRVDVTGCLTPTKDEIRIVNLPNGFRDPTSATDISTSEPASSATLVQRHTRGTDAGIKQRRSHAVD